ncbi:MAG: hypothetical protein WB392_10880 [Methanotrichaceae archaeon]
MYDTIALRCHRIYRGIGCSIVTANDFKPESEAYLIGDKLYTKPLPAISSKDLSESNSLLDSSNISYTIWITSATYIPMIMNAEIKFALTPASLKGGSDSMPYFRIDAATNETVVFSDFNVPEKIEEPAEAKSPH